jgi:hypothetical protein
MKTLTFLLIIGVSGMAFASESPEIVKVYCFSADLEAGFKDDSAAAWCRILSERGDKKKSIALTESKADAHVLVEYLGIEKIEAQGDATYLLGGYAWTPNQTKTGARAVITVGDFKKGFFASGINFQAPSGVIEQTESWIRENRETILQKASKN